MKARILLASVCVAALGVAGCANQNTPAANTVDEKPAPVGKADVNPGEQVGDVRGPAPKDDKLPSLNDLKEKAETKSERVDLEKDGNKLRASALKEAALSYGARGGLAWASREINEMLRSQSETLGEIFSFQRLMLAGPDGASVRPPVIVRARDDYELENGGQMLRLADQVYRIVDRAQFQPEPPRWQTYLLNSYEAPEPPQQTLLPQNKQERKVWRENVEKGWKKGVKQAHNIFQSSARRLERDFTGMITYRILLARGMVSEPIMAEGELGVTETANGRGMRVNDRALRVTRDSHLISDPDKWRTIVEDAAEKIGADETDSSKNNP